MRVCPHVHGHTRIHTVTGTYAMHTQHVTDSTRTTPHIQLAATLGGGWKRFEVPAAYREEVPLQLSCNYEELKDDRKTRISL